MVSSSDVICKIYIPSDIIFIQTILIKRLKGQEVHREQVHPLSKICAERSRYSNRAVTLIKQSHNINKYFTYFCTCDNYF